MTPKKSFTSPSIYEEHVRLYCDGSSLHCDGYHSGPDAHTFPEFYQRGMCAIYHVLESQMPGLFGISVLGLWEDAAELPFCAFDLFLQVDEEDGFYLPSASAIELFSRHGIPYYLRSAR